MIWNRMMPPSAREYLNFESAITYRPIKSFPLEYSVVVQY